MAITRKEKKDIIKTSHLSRYYEKKIFYEKDLYKMVPIIVLFPMYNWWTLEIHLISKRNFKNEQNSLIYELINQYNWYEG